MTENYSGAMKQLQDLTEIDADFIDGWLLLGELYKEEGDFEKGKLALEKTVLLGPDYSSKAYYFLAECNWNLDNYDDCIIASEKFLTFSDISRQRKLQAEQFIANSKFAAFAVKHPVPFDPKSLGDAVNTDAPEYLPSLTGDEKTIVFTRRIGNGRNANEDFFQSVQKNTIWSNTQPLNGINSAYNEGAQSMTPDGSIIYFVVCDKPNGYGSCDIYFTQKKGVQWSEPRNVGAPVCTNAWETQPSISADGKILFFTSTRTGGKGGSDIWISTKDKNGKWSNPVNAGDSINTPLDEKTPFFHSDGMTLYFSSPGHPGIGKDDIFYSRKKEDGSWSRAVNIGYPINTKNDENSLIVSLDGKHAYFASDRFKLNRDMDLYYFDLYNEARPKLVTYVRGIVTDAADGTPLAAELQLIDLETGIISGEATADSQSGNYLVSIPTGKNYAMNVSAKGYLFYSENFSLKDFIKEEPFQLNIQLQAIKTGSTVVLKNIFFESDSYLLKDESKAELNKLTDLLQQNSTLKIQISGHTDNQGTAAYNQLLSENRAKTVYDYLVVNGIIASRLTYKGYGETKPLQNNDTETGKSVNRRTEFTVTGL
ncbi:MAG: PD40 domain-containing protein [Chitinophagaceae bacterium]|nr:PD40 domain-containing protein [Chitinophagaceae bacterium]